MTLVLLGAAPALGAFPGSPPDKHNYPGSQESPRVDPPDDPKFDPCEPQDPQNNPDGGTCDSYFSEEFRLFGFRPESANRAPGVPLTYDNCAQLDAQGRDANVKKGDPQCAQISGIRADSAWKFSTGSPRVVIAIFDNGIEWQNRELVDKVHLNPRELPRPQAGGDALRPGVDCSDYRGSGDDRNRDGAFNVADFACDPRVSIDGGDEESDGLLDASDLIAAFSNGRDDDRNRYTDDIAGWDYFDDDNDPLDSAACCQGGHGTDRAANAAGATDNGLDEAGVCPDCQIMPLRTSDDIIHDTNLDGMATVYAADNGASVTECACGDLLNPNYARRAWAYAERKGVAQMMVSSDINSANHNYPTNYNEAIYVSGSLPDTAPSESCQIPGLPGIGGFLPGTPGQDEFEKGCKAFLDLIHGLGVPSGIGLPGQLPTTSFFRNPNLTQYGGKNDIVLVGATGSQNTSQAAGAAGLLKSYARERGFRLTGNEVRQLLTMTAEDVLPENTGTIGQPDKANPGWDTHFGYGRVNLAEAMHRVQISRIPPQVQIDSPDWFTPIDVDKLEGGGVPVYAHVRAPRFGGGVTWKLEYACGQEVTESDFQPLAEGSGPVNGQIAQLPSSLLDSLAGSCDGSVVNDAGRPAGRPAQLGGPWPLNPYPEPDPERHAFQIRLTARQKSDPGNLGQYRKTLFAYRDDDTLPAWPRPLAHDGLQGRRITGSGGESSPRLADLDGDDRLDVVLATSSGELRVVDEEGRPLKAWNRGRSVFTLPYELARVHGDGLSGPPPREPLRVPAIGDITGDGEPEVVATAGERIYAWHRDGSRVKGFPQRVDTELSAPCKPGVDKPCFDKHERLRTPQNHVKTGYFGSAALADLDGDGRLDVVAGALDQRLYAYDGEGRLLHGFPVRLDSEGEDDGAEIIATPTIAQLDDDPEPEVVIATNETVGADNSDFNPNDIFSLFIANATGASPTYAVNGDGSMVDGWPVANGILLANPILPLVLPSANAAAADIDPSSEGDEVSISSGSGGAKLVASDGTVKQTYTSQPNGGSTLVDQSLVINVADYSAIGRLGDGDGVSVIKGGFSLAGAANLVAVNQNVPFNHSVQAWDPTNGQYRPRWPVATDDFQLITEPAIARVAEGSGRQALVGTGMYQVHAYGADGADADGWPKFTGGWLVAVPAVGDVDGDGKLDVVTFTREGWAFAWSTGIDACQTGGSPTNAEWWTFSHDEFSTANYGTDSRPPSIPGSPTARKLSNGDVELRFAPSGDDLRCGEADRYEVVGADGPIRSGRDFRKAQALDTSPGDPPGDGHQALVVSGGEQFRHLAVRAVDDAGNVSYVAAVKTGH